MSRERVVQRRLRTLGTLEEREYRAGLGEVGKYGVILDAGLFDHLEANVAGLLAREHDLLVDVIARCCRLKAEVVRQDERDDLSGVGRKGRNPHPRQHARVANALPRRRRLQAGGDGLCRQWAGRVQTC